MADLEPVLEARLKAHVGLAALISTRVFPVVLRQSTPYPAVTYQRIGTDPLSGMTADHGISMARIQIDSWGETYASAKNVAAQVRDALKRYSDSGSNPELLDSFLDNELDDFEPDLKSGGGVYRVIQDYIVHYRE